MDITCNSLTPEFHGGASPSARPTAFLTGNVHKPHHLFRRIPITQGKYAIVDEEDYKRIRKRTWYYQQGKRIGYANTTVRLKSNGKVVTMGMHRLVMNLPSSFKGDIDHRDGDGLNNRKNNLRACTRKENEQNQQLNLNNKSGYKGVTWKKDIGKWRTQIKLDKITHLGCFTCLVKAAVAYDKAAIKYFGEYARLNFPELKHK